MRKLQTTLTRIFIVLESESHGLSDFGRFILKNETEISAKIRNSNGFSAQKQVSSQKKKKKKRSSPKLRRIFRTTSETQTLFQAESRHLLHNFGTQFPLGGLFSFFHQKSASKAPKTCDFAYFTGQWGGSSPLPLPWLRYWCQACTLKSKSITYRVLQKNVITLICFHLHIFYTRNLKREIYLVK